LLKTLIKKLTTLALSIDYQVLGAHDGPTCTSVANCTFVLGIILLSGVREIY